MLKAAEQRFSPEFRNRIDEIVVFSPLTMDEVKQIAQFYLEKTNRQMCRLYLSMMDKMNVHPTRFGDATEPLSEV